MHDVTHAVRWQILRRLAVVMSFGTSLCSAQGSICAIGGGGEDYGAWSDAPYRWIVQRADSQRIVLLSANPENSWLPTYFRSLGADSVFNLMIASPAVANDSATYAAIRACRGVFIKGGDQWDYVSVWRGTLTEQAIREVYLAGGVVAGTSAGAAVLGEIIFDAHYASPTSRTALRNPRSTGLSLTTDFLRLLPNALFDSHFYERARFGRLLAMMGRFQVDTGRRILGIGLEAETALCISPDGTAEVMGAGSVVFYYPSPQSRVVAATAQPLVYTDVRCDALVAGYRYDLNAHQVSYVPPTATVPGPGTAAPVVNPITLFGDAFPSVAGVTQFLNSAGGTGGAFAVVAPPSAAAAGQRLVDTLLGRGASAALVPLDAASADDSSSATTVSQAQGIAFSGNASELFPSYVDSTTLVGQALRTRLLNGVAVAFLSQDAKLAGRTVVFRTELEELASIRGKLVTGTGLTAFRNLVVMPLIFQSDVYDENRTAGLPWGMAVTDGKTGIYLDEGGFVSIDGSGVIQSTGLTPAVVIDGREVTAVGYSTYRHSGSVGPRQSTAMVGATLHVLAGDVRFDALSGAILTGVQEEPRSLPAAFGLLWSYPNPFNGTTVLGFRVLGPGAQGVKLTVYDMLGREDRVVVNESRTPGTHTVLFDAAGLSSGVYIVRLESSGRSAAHKLLLLR
jgi:cyanophycinase